MAVEHTFFCDSVDYTVYNYFYIILMYKHIDLIIYISNKPFK